MFFSTQFLQSNTTQQHARCIRHGLRFGKVFPPTYFSMHDLVQILYSCICFFAPFSCNACQSVSLCISLCSLEHCFTASTRNMSENNNKKKNIQNLRISHDPLVIFSSCSHQHASLIAWSEIYCHVSRFTFFRLSYSIQVELQG